jgi:hypothetical protein
MLARPRVQREELLDSPNRGPPYWKSTALRRKALGDAA